MPLHKPVQALTEDFGYGMEDVLDDNPKNSPEASYLACEVRVKCLRSMTECLSREQRRVFCLAITLGLPHKQVADILEWSLGKVNALRAMGNDYRPEYAESIAGQGRL
jgi:RNA polymerase sigma-70 factor (ECF subfamily)